jgi:hypothetical protein
MEFQFGGKVLAELACGYVDPRLNDGGVACPQQPAHVSVPIHLAAAI